MARRADADRPADVIFGSDPAHVLSPGAAMARWAAPPLPQVMAALFVRRLRGREPSDRPLLAWLIDHPEQRGRLLQSVGQGAQDGQGATQATMRNIVTRMMAPSVTDWAEHFGQVSVIDALPCGARVFAVRDFATRRPCRTPMEELSRGPRGAGGRALQPCGAT